MLLEAVLDALVRAREQAIKVTRTEGGHEGMDLGGCRGDKRVQV